jgi:GTP cyclohydrolase I
MYDVQKEKDTRNIPLKRVGVSDVLYPIRVMDKTNGTQHTVAKINMHVNLPKEFRGTHMSRFLEVLNKHRCNMHIRNIEQVLDDMKTVLNAEESAIEVRFPYFILKKAPVTKIESFMSYDCAFLASKREKMDFILEVNTPVHNLCPCSKAISKYGAHNQRGIVTIKIRMKKLVWIEEVVEIAEKSASAPLYSLLKREDEKYITETAYENPRFVEDVVREASIRLMEDSRITYFSVEAKNFESIHNHNAYAFYELDKRAGKK